ncbi:hypothetical protein C2W64_00279 [Brevibacillus laterosporus]|nr:hypothetical protein C2W64_00279 [Brevibacillus laterosporus]
MKIIFVFILNYGIHFRQGVFVIALMIFNPKNKTSALL